MQTVFICNGVYDDLLNLELKHNDLQLGFKLTDMLWQLFSDDMCQSPTDLSSLCFTGPCWFLFSWADGYYQYINVFSGDV